MKNKIIITLLISSTLLSCILLTACKKEEPIEPMPTVEPIVEETTVEIETTTEEVMSTTEQGTVEGHEVTEEAVEETVTDGVDSTSTDVILGEGEYKGDEIDIKSFDEATQNVLNRAKELYEAGLLSKEEYDAVVKDATGLNSLVNDLQNSQPGHIDKDVGYGTPSDPSQYGTNPYKDVDLPAHLKGDVVQ